MAKDNFILHGSRGSIGNLTARKTTVGTVLAAKVTSTTNTKTSGQMLQRAKFANCVKFFTNATSGVFQFAYEDRKKGESYFNAFMRHNISKFAIATRELTTSRNFPAIGKNILMANGSLPTPTVNMNNNTPYVYMNGLVGANTVGALSAMLISSYSGVKAGDIVTVVQCSSDVTSAAEDGSFVPVWSVSQFFVDKNSTKALTEINESWAVSTLGWQIGTSSSGTAGYAVVFSRKTAKGLKVSNSTLTLNNTASSIFTACQDDDYINAALETWGASEDTILEGSLAKSSGSSSTGGTTTSAATITGFRGWADSVAEASGLSSMNVGSTPAASYANSGDGYLVIEGSNLDKLKASDFTTNDSNFTVELKNTNSTYYLVLTAISKVTLTSSMRVQYQGVDFAYFLNGNEETEL